MELVISLIHVLSCILIIGVILIQSGKGGGLGAGFGGASSAAQQIFGGRGAGNFLTRSTVALAVIFMTTSITLAYLSSRPRSLLDLSETSGAVSSDEDTIIEQGSGELVVIGADGAEAPQDAQPKEEFDPSQFQLQQQPDGEMKLDLQMPTSPDEAGAAEPEAEVEPTPAAEPEEAEPAAEEPAEKPAAAKPAPKPAAKPKAKPAVEKPAAEEAPAAEEKPAAPAEEAPAEEAPAEEAPAEEAPEAAE